MKSIKFILGVICLLVGLFFFLAFIFEYVPNQLIKSNNPERKLLGGIFMIALIFFFFKFGLKWVKKK
ncbi:hypothetical protein [Moheibacter sediminis]|uniref:hypothetical protein n=1 Tax=Moheibacter sediminis TaxID=1434700 RepID=UPI000A077FB1|nr:hypothetical protein [Moheibacter sediminis]